MQHSDHNEVKTGYAWLEDFITSHLPAPLKYFGTLVKLMHTWRNNQQSISSNWGEKTRWEFAEVTPPVVVGSHSFC
jgi:hypothetical protein